MKLCAPRPSRCLLTQGASARAGMFPLFVPRLTDLRSAAG